MTWKSTGIWEPKKEIKSAHRKLKPFEKNVNLEAAAISTGNTQEDTKNQNLLTQVPGNKSIRKNS